MKRVLMALVLAVGCAPEPVVVERPSYRDRSVAIASQVDVAIEEIEGEWVVRSTFSPFKSVDRVRILRWAGRYFFTLYDEDIVWPSPDLSDDGEAGIDTSFGGIDFETLVQGRARALVTSRWPVGAGEQEVDFWILWADFDRRTMAIGTPDGSFGFILDRNPTGGEDRIAAALDIMAWLGYRVEEMEVLP